MTRSLPVMLDLKYVAQNFDAVLERLKTRSGSLDLGAFQKLFTERRELYIQLEALQHRRNQANEEMKKKAREDPKAIDSLRTDMRTISQDIKDKESRLGQVEQELEQILLFIPNLPDASVPIGASENDNPVVKTFGEKPNLLFQPRQHFELG